MESFELSMQEIKLEFPGVMAIKEGALTIKSGEVHALIGANGAGKSSMMKVLCGYYDHWSGSMSLNGNSIEIRSIQDAKTLKIETVYQEVDVALIPYLSVAENIMIDALTQDMQGKTFVNWKAIYKEATKILDALNLSIDVTQNVESCTLAEKQMILIARSVSRACHVLILDEPTAPLSNTEAKELFRVVDDLKAQGVAIVFISHRLPEIFEMCDHITIMRDGKTVATLGVDETHEAQVVELMLGRTFESSFPKHTVSFGDVALELSNVSDDQMIKDINLHVRKGEIIGIAGLVGAGKTELCKTIFGVHPLKGGAVKKDGALLKIKDPSDAVNSGLALIPEERRKEGIMLSASIKENMTMAHLGAYAQFGFVNQKQEVQAVNAMIDELAIKVKHQSQNILELSGGNQQKVVVGKWLLSDADCFIFDEPTKGVDIGAKKDMFELIGGLVSQGKSVIYASCENNELLGITDRIYIMYDGKIVKEVLTHETTEDEILYYSAGGTSYECEQKTA